VREDVLLAVGEVKLVVKAMGVVCCILPHVLYDDSRFAAKVLYVAVIADDY
jgi:hypothetical protein